MEKDVKNSAAKIKANNKYSKSHYKRLAVDIKPADYIIIDTFCKQNSISKAAFIVAACKYCIDNKVDLRADKMTDENK